VHTLAEVLHQFPAAVSRGLTPEQVTDSRRQFGSNRLTPLPREPLWKKFLAKFDEPIIKILLAAALLSMVVDLFQPPAETLPPHPPLSPTRGEGRVRGLLGGAALGVIGSGLIAAYLLKRAQWVPGLLFTAALILFPIGVFTGHPSVDGFAVMVAVILATGVAFISEFKSDREFELLNAQKEASLVKVLRDGQFHTISLEETVFGDAVMLETGDEIPADGRVVKAADLYVDQSLMTGESEPVRKQPSDEGEGPELPGCLYRGTQVVDGVGEMVVTEVGDATYLGQIARHLSAQSEEESEVTGADEGRRIKRKLTIAKDLTPLQQKLEHLAGLISKVGYMAAVAIFLALLVRGFLFGEVGWPEPGLWKSLGSLLNYFMYMVIVIVVAVPEGLPMSVTVSLALAMRKMTRANSLVRQLVACETVGSTTVICSDKTGTLTKNQMAVVRLAWNGQVYDRDTPTWVQRAPLLFPGRPLQPGSSGALPESGHDSSPLGRMLHPLEWIALNAAVNSTANLEAKHGPPGAGVSWIAVGNSTEGALLQWLHEAAIVYHRLDEEGMEYHRLRLLFEPVYRIHFSSERKRMTTVIRWGDRLVSLVKGAPEWVLEQSRHYLAADGSEREWTREARQAVTERLRDSADRAMRTLAFGYAVLTPDTPADYEGLQVRRDELERGLVFVGFVGIRDPLREDVHEALQQCRRAGIEVKMVTGDNLETARAIGREIGLFDRPDAEIITSQEFNAASDEQVKASLPRLRILARARPLDKFRLVKLLQETNEVVAVTGDGTNDAPALKKADVGLAMGRAGTEVAKEASKIVLLDDAFSTIVKAVHWGRSLYENIQRFIQFQLTINVSALAIAFLGPFFGVRPPFTILQLLWINVVMDTFASIALCSEPPRPGLMQMPPRRRDESILTRSMLQNIFTTAAFFIVVMMGLLLGLRYGHWFAGTGEDARDFPGFTTRQVSIFFTVYIFFQVWNEINCRSLVPQVSSFQGLFRNRVFLGIVGTIVVVQVVIISFGGSVFQVEPLGILDWLAIAGLTASVLLFAEIVRLIRLAGRRSAAKLVP
jgi:Ca2+-transporting ATPase